MVEAHHYAARRNVTNNGAIPDRTTYIAPRGLNNYILREACDAEAKQSTNLFLEHATKQASNYFVSRGGHG